MPEPMGSVQGEHSEHKTMLYALSTCIWCKRTRQFLEDNQIAFDYVYVDLLRGAEREDALGRVRRWNPGATFPTLVVDDSQCVVGAQLDRIREVLEL